MDKAKIPLGLCQCGCGGKTNLATESCPKKGRMVRGVPYDYIAGHHLRKEEKYKIDPNTGCWIWQLYTNDDGYGVMWYEEKGRSERAHVVYYERRKGVVQKGKTLHHICERPPCVNPDHLEPLTRGEHRRKHAAINPTIVKQIALLHAAGFSSRFMAKLLNRPRSTVQNVLRGRTWKGVI
jgi:hypothetical protein